MRVSLLFGGILGLVGCGPELVIVIDAPSPEGQAFETEAVALQATVTLDGERSDAAVSWSTNGWTADGQDIEVDDLPLGELTLTAVATLDDLTAEATTTFLVEEIPLPVAYGGSQNINIELIPAGGDPFALTCNHRTLALSLDFAGNISGEGMCNAYSDYTFVYSGTVTDGVATGDMVLTSQDTAGNNLQFTGTLADDGVLVLNFDHTWDNEDGSGSLRVFGSTTATPE